MTEGWKALNEMQGSGKSEDEISISPGALDESQNHVRRHTNPSRTRDQSVREWVEEEGIEVNPDGFEGEGTDAQISEYLSDVGEDAELDYADSGSMSVNVTKSGVASVAQDLYEQDLVTVDTPEMDRSGVSGDITMSVDGDRLGDYLEEVSDEFDAAGDGRASASAAVALGLEAIFQGVQENYEGEVEIRDYGSGKPQSDIPSDITPSRSYEDHHDGDKIVEGADYIPEAADAAMETYEDNVHQAERQRQRAEQQEDDGGLIGKFL
jgi:hypothetical protein